MKRIAGMAALLTAVSGTAFAGGVDRSGQGIGFMFEKGNYAELSYSTVTPSVTATPDAFGNVALGYTSIGLAFKYDLNDKISLGLKMDEPFGADVFYTALDLGAELNSQAITAIGRYKFNDNFSVHAGVSSTSVDGFFNPAGPFPAIPIAKASDVGYLVGAAYERPDIAARVALTYYTGTTHTDPLSASNFNAPDAINLDFQTGIAANTLLFGSIRQVNWSDTVITVAGTDIVTYDNDSTTYNLGVGRKFNDNWSGAITVGYEASQGGIASALSPTDGNTSVGLGVTYTTGNLKITGGVRSIQLGDATTAGLPVNTWSGNSAMAAGLKVSFTF